MVEVVDGGDRACGELLLVLAARARQLGAGVEVRLIASDPAAAIDLPAWCYLTGHEFLAAATMPDGRACYDVLLTERAKAGRGSKHQVTTNKENAMNGLVINLTHSVDDLDRTSVAMVVAGASVASAQDTTVFLSSEGTRLAAKGVAETLHEEGFAPLGELVSSFVEAGGRILVCSPCAKKRGIGEDDLIDGASIVGGATLVALLADGAASLSS